MAGLALLGGGSKLLGAANLGLTGLTLGMGAAEELNRRDPLTGESEPAPRNLTAGAGELAGGVAGGALGMLGGPFAALTMPLGAWAGSQLGGGAGRSIARLAEPSELDRQIRDSAKMNDALRDQRMLSIPVSEAEGRSANRLQREQMEAVASVRQREAQQQALLASALAGSARPVPSTGLAEALMGATNGLI